MFDNQNGVFWETDGQTLFVGKRSSTYQLAGKVSVTNGSNTVTQTDALFPTSYTKQLEIGDFVVIRGQSYRIQDIASDTSMTIAPDYRGPTGTFVNVSKTVDTKVPQSQFNIDKLDGTGPSGYVMDLTKMQMFYIDYTWYGAGFVRYGIRGPRGDVIYVHKTPNNNVNSEAYMRSGNLPARYEASTLAVSTKMMSTTTTGATTISVADTSKYPSSGTLCIRNGTVYEYVNYTGKTSTSFTGLVREQAGTAYHTVTVAGGTDRVFVSAQLNVDWEYVTDGSDYDVVVRIIRERGFQSETPGSTEYLFAGTVLISEKTFPFTTAAGSGTDSLEAIFTTVLDGPNLDFAYYRYYLEVRFNVGGTGPSSYATTIGPVTMGLRSLVAQVVKQ
jgi:hypothetical protein